MADETTRETTPISPEQMLIFRTEDLKAAFIEAHGPEWQTLIKARLQGELPGTYELFDTRDLEEEIIGAVRVDEAGEYYLLPFAGAARQEYEKNYQSHEDE